MALFLLREGFTPVFAWLMHSSTMWNRAYGPVMKGGDAQLVVVESAAVSTTTLLVAKIHWSWVSHASIASRHATCFCPFAKLFVRMLLLVIHYDWLTRKLHFKENSFESVIFAIVLLPTSRAYLGLENSSIGSYVKFLLLNLGVLEVSKNSSYRNTISNKHFFILTKQNL